MTSSKVVPDKQLKLLEQMREMTKISAQDIPRQSLFMPVTNLSSITKDLVKKAAVEKTYKKWIANTELDKRNRNSLWVINPKWKSAKRWDGVMVFLLIYTAAFTPYEVAFLETTEIDFLFIVNRIVDVAFSVDIVVNFFLGSIDVETRRPITNLGTIRYNYLTSWFAVDVMSVLPFDVLSFITNIYYPQLAKELANLKVLRVIRLLRLIKLLRVLKASSLLGKWQSSIGISFAAISITKYAVSTMILAHWMACAFRLLPAFLDPSPSETWVYTYGAADDPPLDQYVSALYWSITTVTTVGYGDVTPQSSAERVFCTLGMLIGGMFYAYVIGGVCGIVASMDEVGTSFRQTMDMLNLYMDDVGLPFESCVKLREYFMYSKDLHRSRFYKEVLHLMSPGLQEAFAMHCHGHWTKHVYFFKDLHPHLIPKDGVFCSNPDDQFTTQIAMALVPETYPPAERIIKIGEPTDNMYIIHRGLCACLGQVLGNGRFFGEDMILQNATRNYNVLSITFSTVYVLSKHSVNRIIDTGMFPRRRKFIRKSAIKLCLMRFIVATAKEFKEKGSSASLDAFLALKEKEKQLETSQLQARRATYQRRGSVKPVLKMRGNTRMGNKRFQKERDLKLATLEPVEHDYQEELAFSETSMPGPASRFRSDTKRSGVMADFEKHCDEVGKALAVAQDAFANLNECLARARTAAPQMADAAPTGV